MSRFYPEHINYEHSLGTFHNVKKDLIEIWKDFYIFNIFNSEMYDKEFCFLK